MTVTSAAARPRHRKCLLGSALLLACLTFAGETQPDEDPRRDYILGIPPILPPERLELTFGHMAKRFGEVLGRDVRFRTSTTFARYTDNLMAEQYDFAQVPPSVFFELESGSYVALARAPGSRRSEFIVLENSPIEHLRDLVGKIVTVHPQNEMTERTTEYALREAGLEPDEDVQLRYLESPLSCLQQVLAGTAAACLTSGFARERYAEKMNVRLRIVGYTAPVPFGPFVANRRVPAEERDAIRKLLMRWKEDPRNAPTVPVSGAQVPSFVPVEPGDYDRVFEIWRHVRER